MKSKEVIASEKNRSMITNSLIFGGIGAIVGLSTAAVFKMSTKYKFILPAIGIVLGVGTVLLLNKEKELKGKGEVSAEAKKNRNITFTKV